jgi:hypothetical protein
MESELNAVPRMPEVQAVPTFIYNKRGVAAISVSGSAAEPKGVMRERFEQYRKMGVGLAPCQGTVPKLGAGVYEIGVVQETITFIPKEIITDDIIHFDDSKSSEIISDIERFWSMKERFLRYGLTFKRGFLLHGPPGSGKTATVNLVIADMINRGGIVIINSHFGIVSQGLFMLRDIEPDRPVVVIWEDIDGMLGGGNDHTALALLDGESQLDNIVFIASTNYPERLAQRLKNRPSRFDKVIHIGMPSPSARRAYIRSRVKEEMTEADLTSWVQKTAGLSIAHIKELIISVFCYGSDIDESIARLRKMAEAVSSDDKGYGAEML